jgi:hypothetical protein
MKFTTTNNKKKTTKCLIWEAVFACVGEMVKMQRPMSSKANCFTDRDRTRKDNTGETQKPTTLDIGQSCRNTVTGAATQQVANLAALAANCSGQWKGRECVRAAKHWSPH